MTHLWLEGFPVIVIMDEIGDPLQLIWRGDTHNVVKVANRWIIDENWWVERIYRDYYMVTTDTMLLLVIYCDINSDQWFVQRLYD